MVDVPRSDQERHLRAIIPEWLTRPPEQEMLRRQQLADEAALDAHIQGVERREVLDTVRAAALLALGVQFMFTGFAPKPLLAALVLGLALGWVVHRVGEGVFVWVVTGLACGIAAAAWMGGPIAPVMAPGLAALIGGIVGTLRDPVFRV
jgi:hypothetical protein